MIKITIMIDSNNVTVNQNDITTKVDNNKKFFIISRNNKYDECSFVEFVTDDYITAVNKLKDLITNKTDLSYTYEFTIIFKKYNNYKLFNIKNYETNRI